MSLKTWFTVNKHQILVMVLVMAAFFIVGCVSGQGNSPPPSGPIGGGCG